jgi:hypothetical protein
MDGALSGLAKLQTLMFSVETLMTFPLRLALVLK